MTKKTTHIVEHFIKRMYERYNRVVTEEFWETLNRHIQEGNAEFLGYKETSRGEVWYCKGIVVLVCDGLIGTALPKADYQKAIDYKDRRTEYSKDSGTFYVAKSMIKMFYGLDITEQDWEIIKILSKSGMVMKYAENRKLLKRVLFKGRELFILMNNEGFYKVARPTQGLQKSVKFRKRESASELLSNAIRSNIV